MPTSLINFAANGTVTVNAQSNITTVGNLTGLQVNGVSNLNTISNVKISGGSNGQVIVTDGTGNLSFANSGSFANGTVTQIDTTGNGLGFTLTGGPITSTGTITLTIPSAGNLRSSLTIGNVANLNLNGNTSTYLAGDGNFTVPAGTYSNSNVANYLPTYTGNITAGNANLGNTVSANYFTGNGAFLTGITAVNANYANFAGNIINSNQPNITNLGTLTSLTVSGNTNFTGSNVSLGNVANLHITGGINGYYLQTDGTGNLSWVTGGGSGNGVVGGSNTQVQFNDAGNFGGNPALTFDKTTGITTGSFEDTFRGLVKNQGQIVSANIQGNTTRIDFNVLDGPILINTGNLNFTAGNAGLNLGFLTALNFRGNATTSLDSILNVGDSINLTFIQKASFARTQSNQTNAELNLSVTVGGNSSLYNQIDGTDIDLNLSGLSNTNSWINGRTYSGNANIGNVISGRSLILKPQNFNTSPVYGYISVSYEIIKIDSDPTYVIKYS